MKQQSVLITGATAGIGYQTALDLLAAGHQVIAAGRNEAALLKLATQAGGNDRLRTLRLDVTDSASVAAAVVAVDRLTNGRGLDVLINNAGYMTPAPLADQSDADLRAQFETNVFGLMAVTRAFLPQMFKRRAGRVVNVSSVSGRFPAPLVGGYHATKYALEALSDALRMETHAFGIKVIVIEPGTIRTEFADRSQREARRAQPRDTLYGSVYERADAVAKAADRIAVDPSRVSGVIARAVASRCPKARYLVPRRAWLALVLHALMPTCLFDALMRRLAGLTPRQLGMGGRKV
jgi:NADP-dependent 3-hydroxy acid dehydrogenase YdfG